MSIRTNFVTSALMPEIGTKNQLLSDLSGMDPSSPEFTKKQQELTEQNEKVRRLLSLVKDLNDQAMEEWKMASQTRASVWK